MEDFATAVKSICLLSAAVYLTENLISGTRLRSHMKLILSLIFALFALTPFIKGSFGFELPELSDYDEYDIGTAEEMYSDELIRITSENISDILMQQITASGISCSRIETEINISEQNVISINRVIVSADDFDSAAEIIKNSIGVDTEVVNGDL